MFYQNKCDYYIFWLKINKMKSQKQKKHYVIHGIIMSGYKKQKTFIINIINTKIIILSKTLTLHS